MPLAIDDHPVGVVGIAVAAPSLLLRGHPFSVKKLWVKLSPGARGGQILLLRAFPANPLPISN